MRFALRGKAVALIDTLTEAVGIKDASPAVQEQATVVRNKAFALVVRTYDEIRAAIGCARRAEGDGDLIAPSLYVGRSNGGGKRSEEAANDNKEEATTTTTQVNNATPPSPVGLTASLAANGNFQRPTAEG